MWHHKPVLGMLQSVVPTSHPPTRLRACPHRFVLRQVYALDLLGQGRSEKPVLDYSMELWRDQILDFMAAHVQQPAVIVGNSIGSLASLMVTEAAPARILGTVLLNCAGGMNNKAIRCVSCP